MKEKKKNFKNIFIAFALIFASLFISILSYTTPLSASAVTVTGYTSVLGDLKIDDNFKKEDYPSNSEDLKTFKIIQIAESSGGELFIYTYQPSALNKQFDLTTITISQSIEDNAKYRIYELKLLDSDGVFSKYKVKGIELKSDILRYYDITEIHRKFDSDFGDKQPSNGNTTTEIALNISQRWTAATLNGQVYYNLVTLETLVVEAKYVGFVRYKNSSAPSWIDKDSVDSHFVAFSIGSHDFDDLVEADVYYKSQLVKTNSDPFVSDKYYDLEENYVSLKADTKVTINENHTLAWKTNMYEYNEIQTVSEFFSSVSDDIIYEHGIYNTKVFAKMTPEFKKNIQNMQYVLRFAATDYDYFENTSGYAQVKETFTNIQDVTILSLTFMKDGDTIKLGVIDNKTNGSGVPDVIYDVSTTFAEWFVTLLKVLGFLFVLIIIGIVFQALGWLVPILKFLGIVLLKVVKILWWLITAPVEFIKWIIKKE